MKILNIILATVLAFVGVSCKDALFNEVSLDIRVEQGQQAVMDGNVVTVKKGEPVTFLFDGNADFISFFSGEKGAKYINRNRTSFSTEELVSMKLEFNVKSSYGAVENSFRMLYSDKFPGISQTDFEADSVLVENFEWMELVPQESLPRISGQTTVHSVDLSQYIGIPMTLAVCYKQPRISPTLGATTVDFSDFKIVNSLKDGTEEIVYANQLGFTPLNMLNKWDVPSYEELGDNREYGSNDGSLKNVIGLWNLKASNVSLGNFSFNGGWTGDEAVTPKMYSWLVSSPMQFNICNPDNGVKIKDSSMALTSYTYTYEKIGIYDAVFLARNINMDSETEQVKHIIVNVVE